MKYKFTQSVKIMGNPRRGVSPAGSVGAFEYSVFKGCQWQPAPHRKNSPPDCFSPFLRFFTKEFCSLRTARRGLASPLHRLLKKADENFKIKCNLCLRLIIKNKLFNCCKSHQNNNYCDCNNKLGKNVGSVIAN